MKTFTDHLNNTIHIPDKPRRIVSLVPSQTELLFDLGLTEEIKGRTRFCAHPEEKVKNVPSVGGTKNFRLPLIRELNPDLIIANKEENYKQGIEELQKDFPVWVSDIKDLEDNSDMIRKVGEMVGRKEEAFEIAEKIRKELSAFCPPQRYRVAYLIWKKPYMTIGSDTFIHHLLGRAGFENVFGNSRRYPVINAEELHEKKPDIIFLSSEPYPFREKHLQDFEKLFPYSLVKLVDGELFSWHGSRILHSAKYFEVLHKELSC